MNDKNKVKPKKIHAHFDGARAKRCDKKENIDKKIIIKNEK